MLLPSRVSDASFFVLLAYVMAKRDTKGDASCKLDKWNVPGMNRGG